MPNKLDLTQKLLCNKIGKTFELGALKLHCYELTFCRAWLNSVLLNDILKLEETLICQSNNYLLNSFIQENNIPSHSDYKPDENVMYWIGYLFTYWMFMDEINGEVILKHYDLKSILEQYDVLHTQSIKVAIKTIKKHYNKQSVLLDSILHSD